MTKIQAKSDLEKSLFESVEAKTPDYIKNEKLIDLNNKNKFSFRLKKEHLDAYNAQTNPQGLNLREWFKSCFMGKAKL